jgi:hypothetical protein
VNKSLVYVALFSLFVGVVYIHKSINKQGGGDLKMNFKWLHEIPEKFIQYGPKISQGDAGFWEATISFGSSDIPSYSGEDFSTKVFVRYPSTETNSLDCIKSKARKIRNPDRYMEISRYLDSISLDDGREIKAMIVDFSYKNQPSLHMVSVISINGEDVAIRKNIYAGNDVKALNSITEYQSLFRSIGCAEFQIKHSSGGRESNKFFFISKNFIFDL